MSHDGKTSNFAKVVLGDRYSCSDSSPLLDWGRGSGRWVWPHPVPGHILDTAGSSSQQQQDRGLHCTCPDSGQFWQHLPREATSLGLATRRNRNTAQLQPRPAPRLSLTRTLRWSSDRVLSDIDTIPGSSAQYWEKAPICAQLPLPQLKRSLLKYSIINGHLYKFAPHLDWDAKLCMVS